MNRRELPILSPCTADWTRMTLADRGRFCAGCRQVVHDLAQLSEAQARALLASPETAGLCVRYVHDATGEIVFRRDPVRRRRARRAAAILAAASLPLTLSACMGAPQRPPAHVARPAAPPDGTKR